MYGRSYDKVGFNLKFDKKLLGRKSFKLRPDSNDNSKLHSKLCSDIANRLGLPSIQATYARLYMNNEFWGLYVFMDAIKTSWVKQTFNPSEKEVTTLYQCKNGGFNFQSNSAYACENSNDDYPSMDAFKKFVSDANNARNVADLEKIMDVDVFLKYLALEWLIGSFDHFMIYGHNFNWYKRETDGKWVVIYYDYDNTFGTGLSSNLWAGKSRNQDGTQFKNNNQYVQYSFADWDKNVPILGKLVFQNQNKFKQIVHDVLVQAFNPDTLNPHINELKTFLTPYVKEDLTINSQGKLPGRINGAGSKHNSSVSNFENAIESNVKSWIKNKFDVACSNYSFNKNQILSEAASYSPKPYNYGGASQSNNNNNNNNNNTNNTNNTNNNTNNNIQNTSNGTQMNILKNGKIDGTWSDWSWSSTNKFDNQGNLVATIEANAWGGVSFKRNDNVKISQGTLYFKARAATNNASLNVLLHNTDADEYVTIGSVKNVSTDKMTEYSVKINQTGKFDRITIQDANNRGLTLYLNDIYFVSGSGAANNNNNNNNNNQNKTTTTVTITTTIKATTTTTTTTTTTVSNNSNATPVSGDRYNIISNGRIDSAWSDWSWGVEGTNKFDGQGNIVASTVAGSWGGVSFKRNDNVRFGAGTLYFQARVNDTNANLQVLLHVPGVDGNVKSASVKNISTNEMSKLAVGIKEPSNGKFDRITIQDANNRGLKIYLTDVYFVSVTGNTNNNNNNNTNNNTNNNNNNNNNKPVTTTTTITTTTTTIKVTTTVAQVSTNSGTRINIVNNGKFDSAWSDWSWGVQGTNSFDNQGNLVASTVAGSWGGISFKGNNSIKLGAGTLYFQASVNDTSANLQVLAHLSGADEYVTAGTIKNPSTEATVYKVSINEPTNGKYDRITIQDASNRGIKIYLNNVYFVPYTPTTKQITNTNITNNNNNNNNSNNNNNNEKCAQAFSPCGGLNYPDVPSCCEPGFRCEVVNDYYHMCNLDI